MLCKTSCVKGVDASVLFILCYQPPSADITDFVNSLRNILSTEHKNFKTECLLGDFNFPSIVWNENDYHSTKKEGYAYLQLVGGYNLVQMNEVPSTCHCNILDLVSSNTPELYSTVDKCEVKFTSDHAVLRFSINHLITHRQREPKRKVYTCSYIRADFDKIRSELRESNLSNVVVEAMM